MINWILLGIGLVVLYVAWYVSYTSWERLSELGIEHNKSSSSFFDSVLYSGLAGLFISRVVWMVMHNNIYKDVPWGVLPYSRSATEFAWFTMFPWRLFRLDEGIIWPILWIVMGALAILFIFIPTISIERRLKLEKRGIMRAFLIRTFVCLLMTAVYFGALTYFTWGF